jgi:excisionase family DNA binding protein
MPRPLPPPAEPRQLVSVAVAAQRLQLNERTVRRYADRGLLQAYRLGPRAIRLDLAEVDALLHPIPNATTGEPPRVRPGDYR